MADLTAMKRKKVSKSKMGLPKKATKKGGAVSGTYPMPDKAHAINAKARARQELNKGNLTYAEYRTIVNKANNILGGPAGAK